MFPLTRVPFWYRVFEPQPYDGRGGSTSLPAYGLVSDLRHLILVSLNGL